MLGRTVYTVKPRRHGSGWHVLYTHGGGFVHPLRTLHWDVVEALVRHTGASIHVAIYPLAPEHQYLEAFRLLEQVYRGRSAWTVIVPEPEIGAAPEGVPAA